MYPIEAVDGDDGEYNIRGLKLPLKELAACEEEQLSTALGYVCHLVFMISKYLQVIVYGVQITGLTSGFITRRRYHCDTQSTTTRQGQCFMTRRL